MPAPDRLFLLQRLLPITLVTLLSGASSFAQAPPEQITLGGVVRDFREGSVTGGHPDFETTLLFGTGHYAGNIGHTLGLCGKPVFVGGGFKVLTQWQDDDGRQIAPHLANAAWAGTIHCTSVILADSHGVDAFEITFTSVVYNENGTSTWTYHVRELPTGKDLSHWNLAIDETHVVLAGTTPGYTVGVDGSTGFHGIKWDVADSFNEGDFVIVMQGHPRAGHNAVGVLAKGGNNADVEGIDTPIVGMPEPLLVADESLNDIAGAPALSDEGGIESAESFHLWFHDVPGVNVSSPIEITLHRQPDGTYEFSSDEDPLYVARGGFFPIDDQLFGNSPGTPDHNYHFTVDLHTEFTYDEDADQWFSFTGDDDVWVFVNGKLVIDLGGIHSPIEQYIDLDRAGLEDGETATLDLFFAERHRTQSNFHVRTNIEFTESLPVNAITAAFD